MCAVNEEQKHVLSMVLEGHNIFINGYAGTGKTYLLKTVYNELTKLGKNVAITCTTGISCTNFEANFNTSTVHRWSGLHDGRYNSTEILSVVSNNERTMNRIKHTDILIIDEISMLSCKLFDQLHNICSLKDGSKPWGGLQIVVAGDFNQLPPTPNNEYNDEGHFCFNSVHFKKFHKLTLNTVVRQREKQFIGLIRNVSTGMNISEDVVRYIKSFERPIQDEKSVKLFAKHDLVNTYNRKQLISQPGYVYEYRATDSGNRSKLQNVRAPAILWLKENCPVILIRNISQSLVNGLQGKVVKCEQDGPTVHFSSINSIVKLNKISFSVFSPRLNQTVANREQIPVILSYALTIHKAQGMTLDSVEVDCREMFQPGQLGVAIGRVRRSQGLRIINFSPRVCFQQPEEIQFFQAEPMLALLDDLSCCRKLHRVDTTVIVDDFWVEDDNVIEEETGEDFDERFSEIISQIDVGDSADIVEIPADFDIHKIINDCIYGSPVSPIQYEVNQLAINILTGDLYNTKKFCKQQFLELSNIVDSLNVKENVAVKAEKLNEFYAECHKYQTSDKYKLACMLFLQHFPPTSQAHSYICTQITNSVRQYLLHEKAQIFSVSARVMYDRKITNASKARIRYVGGYCIHMLRKKYSSQIKSDLYSTSVEGQASFQTAEDCLNILNSFIEREDVLKQTTVEPQSLTDIDRRQYLSRGLLNITDDLYMFFCNACSISIQYLIDKNFNIYGEHLHTVCLQEMLDNMVLFEDFVHVVSKNMHHFDEFSTNACLQSVESVVMSVMSETLSSVQHVKDLYREIIEKFLLVMLSQFRKDLLESFSVAKTMAHRKQIQTRRQKQSIVTKSVSFQTILNDQTAQKEMSHSLLKGMLLNNSDTFSTMNKKQICMLCKAYSVVVKSSEKKTTLVDKLKAAILSSTSMPNYKVLSEVISETQQEASLEYQDAPQPETSGTSGTCPSQSQPESSAGIETATESLVACQVIQNPIMSEPFPSVSGQTVQMSHSLEGESAEGTESTTCAKCEKIGTRRVKWIQCSECSKWYHRLCAGLRAKKKWLQFSAEGVDFFCCDCT